MKVLNIGGNNKQIPIPEMFKGWENVILDISPDGKPDLLGDARNLFSITEKYDAIYCSHVLEHFFAYELESVLQGFKHVLKPEGFVFVRTPDLLTVIKEVAETNLDLDSEYYLSPAGSITPLDVIYGFQKEITASKKDYMAHKTGFSVKTITELFTLHGFKNIQVAQQDKELQLKAYIN